MTKPLYLAGPVTGVPGLNFAAFAEAAVAIRAMGFPVYSPTEASAADGFDPATDMQAPLADYLARDLPVVCGAAGVVALPGWERSRGALAELFTAVAAGVRVMVYPSMATVDPAQIVGAIADMYGEQSMRAKCDCHSHKDGLSAIGPADKERSSSQIGTAPADLQGSPPIGGPLADSSAAGMWRTAAWPGETI